MIGNHTKSICHSQLSGEVRANDFDRGIQRRNPGSHQTAAQRRRSFLKTCGRSWPRGSPQFGRVRLRLIAELWPFTTACKSCPLSIRESWHCFLFVLQFSQIEMSEKAVPDRKRSMIVSSLFSVFNANFSAENYADSSDGSLPSAHARFSAAGNVRERRTKRALTKLQRTETRCAAQDLPVRAS
jgi:hypothetical protein